MRSVPLAKVNMGGTMRIKDVPFTVTDWSTVEPVEFRGEAGTSHWRTFERGNIRVRVVEYSAGFRADHWCARGHVLFVLEGTLQIALKDGQEHVLSAGMSFQAANGENNPHLALSEPGATVFIVD